METYAHRGMHDIVPENTMASFNRAELMGVDGIETDLRNTYDGQVVLFHDRTFAGRPVADYTWKELCRATGIDVPLLKDVLDQDWKVRWNFEVKSRAAASLAVDLLRKQAPRDALISSFDHDVVHELSTATGLEGALLLASLPSQYEDLPIPMGRVRTLVWDWNIVSADAIRRSRYVDWRNMAYGPVTAGEHKLARMLQLDGVITDHPSLMAGPED